MPTSILNTQVSLFKNYYGKTPEKTVNLLDWLKDDTRKEDVLKVRSLDKTERDKIKATLPCVTVSGTFSARAKAGLIKHSGLLCIDIDWKDNLHIANYNQLKKILSSAPFVACCAMSVSGTGYFVIIPIRYPEKHELHFEALRRVFARLGIQIDAACKDVSRLRGYSWDSEAYINPHAKPFERVWEKTETINPKRVTAGLATSPSPGRRDRDEAKNCNDSKWWVEKYIREISSRGIDITPTYRAWMETGLALAGEFGEAGRQYFHDVSKYHLAYSFAQTDKKYSELLRSNKGNISIGTFFHYCKVGGVKFAG